MLRTPTVVLICLIALLVACPRPAAAQPAVPAGTGWDEWVDQLDDRVFEAHGSDAAPAALPPVPAEVAQWKSEPAKAVLRDAMGRPTPSADERGFVRSAGVIRARAQQALVLEMADAVRAGDVERARVWRARLAKPRGASSTQGALVLQTLPPGATPRADAARVLVREAITWQTTRARQLLDEAVRSTARDVPLPGRLAERVAEAIALADLPPALREAAGVPAAPSTFAAADARLSALLALPWSQAAGPSEALRQATESSLPSLLTPEEKSRRERLLLKLVILVPREYEAGVRDGQITVPLEYRESVTFTAQARQMARELAPLWLGEGVTPERRAGVEALDARLAEADALIAAKADPAQVETALKAARAALEGPLGVSSRRSGSTAEIVEEVLLETRSLLNQSLAAALAGKWALAEQLRLEAYTTFDPDLEARLMPRDPQLAIDIEQLLLDGIDHPGIKVLLDRKASGPELEAAYARVHEALDRAGALLKSGVDPTAAAINAASIVLREGLEGLLVIVAILAGLRGPAHRRKRRLIWLGVLASGVATALTYLLSITIIQRLHAYAEVIEAVTALLAIGILLLITNWLFHQIYWNKWVTTLKAQAVEGENPWQLVTAGFLIGYREGFETVLFLQSLVMDVGGGPVGIGVAIGMLILIALGFAALVLGMKLPYFKLLMITALLIGFVLMAFVGNGVRAMQTVSWLPVHRIASGSWPAWLGQWFGLYNTWETVIGQVVIAFIVLGTWLGSRWKAKRAAEQRRQVRAERGVETAQARPVDSLADSSSAVSAT